MSVFKKNSGQVWLLAILLILDSCIGVKYAVGDNTKCMGKDNCFLNGHYDTQDGGLMESQITSIFADKINNSLKLYSAKSIVNNTIGNETGNITNSFSISKVVPHSSNNTEDDILDAEKVYVYNLKRKLMDFSEPFDASRNPASSTECSLQTLQFLQGLQNFDLWALKMHDATGRMSSGILNGNINQIGDFDQCLGIRKQMLSTHQNNNNIDDDSSLRGKYCLAYVQPELSYKSKRLQNLFKLIQSHGPFKSEFNDPGHRVPRYSLVNWGICVPSACNHQDVEYAVKQYLKNFSASTGISFKVRVEPKMCQVYDSKEWDRNTKWAVSFFTTILTITFLSTLYEYISGVQKNEWLTAFSLKKNVNWLMSTRSTPNDIKTVHGIRFLNALMLLLSHKSMAMFFNPYNNRTEMSESLGRPWTVIGRAASLYTDPFLLFSGMLTSYSLFGRLIKGQPIRLRNEYISRLMRIVPPLAALILFCTYVLPMWGSGPQWNLVVGHHADICKKHWWRNLLFIHNYFGFSEMCLTHTHHLGIDTELFFISPILILGLWRWPRKGLYTLLLLCTLGTGARYYTTIVNQLSNYIYFGTNIQRLFRTADYMYSFPPYRSTVYIMGIILGYVLQKYPNIKLTSSQLRLGWAIAVTCVLLSLLGPAPMGDMSYVYNSTHAAIYAAFAPIAWCLFFSWIVFVAQNGHRNYLTKVLSWKGFQVSTKLSYAIYLTQFPVFFYNVGNRRHIHHYYNFVSIILDTNEFICIVLASIALTILFDAPFQNIKKLIFNKTNISKSTVNVQPTTVKEVKDD